MLISKSNPYKLVSFALETENEYIDTSVHNSPTVLELPRFVIKDNRNPSQSVSDKDKVSESEKPKAFNIFSFNEINPGDLKVDEDDSEEDQHSFDAQQDAHQNDA